VGRHKKDKKSLSKKKQQTLNPPQDCPEIIETARFSSPNSALSEQKLKELEKCISKANDLLRSIGNQSDPNNLRQLQLYFRALKGIKVNVHLTCNGKTVKIEGKVEEAGKNFIQLVKKGQTTFILYDRIQTISQAKSV
jgi:hypothetical protein